MGKKSSPEAPDYAAAAEKTAESNKEAVTAQTWANRATQNNPWGQVSWTNQAAVDPATGQKVTQWTQNTTLDPRLQQALDSQINLQNQRSGMAEDLLGRVQTEFGSAMNWGQLGGWGDAPDPTRATTRADGFRLAPQNTDTSRQRVPGLQNSLDYSGLQDVANSTASRQSAEDAIYKSATSRLDPQWQAREQQMASQLANQGITQGSEAYTKAMADMGRERTDAYAQAQMQAITGAGAEAQRNQAMDMGLRQQQQNEANTQGNFYNQAAQQAFAMGDTARGQQLQAQAQAFNQQYQTGQFGLGQQNQAFNQQNAIWNQGMQGAQYANQLRQQQVAEAIQRRGFSLNEMQALLNGQQVNMPSFGGYNQAQNAGGVDYSGAASNQYGASLDAFNAQQAGMSNAMSGLGSMAGMAMMFSDRRIKRDVRRIGTHPRGFGVYSYRYVGERGRRVGVIAQDVARHVPGAVVSVRGVLAVNLAAI